MNRNRVRPPCPSDGPGAPAGPQRPHPRGGPRRRGDNGPSASWNPVDRRGHRSYAARVPHLPGGLTVRPLTADDLPAAAGLLAAAEPVDDTGEHSDADDLAEWWVNDLVDLPRDSRAVWTDDGVLVAVAVAMSAARGRRRRLRHRGSAGRHREPDRGVRVVPAAGVHTGAHPRPVGLHPPVGAMSRADDAGLDELP
jgi:hypothetical protein